MMVMRYVFLAVLACVALAAVACSGGDAAPSPTDSPSPTASPTRRPTPTPSPTLSPSPTPSPPPAPAIDLSGSQPQQGGFLFVRYHGIGSPVTAYFLATGYALQLSGDHWYGFIGIPTGTTIGEHPLEMWQGDTLLDSTTVSVADGQFTSIAFDLPPSSVDLLVDQERINRERALVESVVSVDTPAKYWTGAWITPTVGEVSSEFGEQRSENGGPYFSHLGMDIANDTGTPVYAAADGVVALNQALLLYGNEVIIDHGVGVYSLYAHLDSSVVAEGQTVQRGDLVGYMGQTGYVTGPHLHWEAIVHGTRVNAGLFTLGALDP